MPSTTPRAVTGRRGSAKGDEPVGSLNQQLDAGADTPHQLWVDVDPVADPADVGGVRMGQPEAHQLGSGQVSCGMGRPPPVHQEGDYPVVEDV
jgi:hypothetical protein